jgi:hypothetical protein
MKLDEEAAEECLNVDNGTHVVLQLADSEIVHMFMHSNKGVDNDDQIDEGTNKEEHISIDKSINLTEELIKGLEQRSFISEQQMWLYEIQESLQKKKINLNV